jgi:hypothetical protein
MNNFWKELSFPPKVLALIIAIVAIGGTVYFTTVFVYGRLTLTSPLAGAYVFGDRQTEAQILPQTFRLKPGRPKFFVAAPGYIGKDVRALVIPFIHRTQSVTLEKDYSYENDHFRVFYQYDRNSYLIVPKIPFSVLEIPEEQLNLYWKDYESYAKEAIEYLRSQGADVKKVPIEWWAKEWWPQGKSITY